MKRAEVWWVEFDPAVGSAVRKTRPAVVVSNDAANRNLARVVVVPLTSDVGRHYPGEALVQVDGKPAKVMADQIVAADKARLKSRRGGLSSLTCVRWRMPSWFTWACPNDGKGQDLTKT